MKIFENKTKLIKELENVNNELAELIIQIGNIAKSSMSNDNKIISIIKLSNSLEKK